MPVARARTRSPRLGALGLRPGDLLAAALEGRPRPRLAVGAFASAAAGDLDLAIRLTRMVRRCQMLPPGRYAAGMIIRLFPCCNQSYSFALFSVLPQQRAEANDRRRDTAEAQQAPRHFPGSGPLRERMGWILCWPAMPSGVKFAADFLCRREMDSNFQYAGAVNLFVARFTSPNARDRSVRPLSFRTARRLASKRRGPDRRGRNPCGRCTTPHFGLVREETETLYRVTAPADPVLVHGNRLGGAKGPQPVPLQCDAPPFGPPP